jgi:hypothetical protein
VKVIVEEPVFVRVNVPFALPVVPTVTVPKSKLVPENVSATEASLPTPARVMVVGLLGSESTIVSIPERVPVAVGVKSMYTTQLLDAARLLPQVELGSLWYCESEYIQLVKVIVEEPVFVRVSAPFVLPVTPTVTVPKFRLVADTASAPALPCNCTNCAPVGSELSTVRISLNDPAAVG